MTTLVDWRGARPADVVPLVEAEAREWLTRLHWDVSDAWHVIEPARQAGELPGALVLDASRGPVGWSAYLRHRNSLQVMTLVATRPEDTRALVDTIMASPEANASDAAIVCVRDTSPGIVAALGAHQFSVQPYRYLVADLERFHPTADVFVPIADSDDRLARLFARAYADDDVIRAFAPGGTLDEWAEYIGQLRRGPGCGWCQADLSLASQDAAAGELTAAILVTHLGPGTAHIAQLAVDPASRRLGLGRRLVEAALGGAAARYQRATLLVSAANGAALSLYTSLGFSETARFIVATKKK